MRLTALATSSLLALAASLPFGVPVRAAAPASPVRVRQPQGSLHGFVVLRTTEGLTIGDGESMQTVAGDRLTSHTVLRLHDGSINDETVVFTQHGTYRLVKYHLVQSGPTFKDPLTMDLDMASGRVVVHSTDDKGVAHEDMQSKPLPADLCNGLIPTLLQDVTADRLPLKLPYLAATPSLRMVTLVFTAAGTGSFGVGRQKFSATDYLVKTDIGGVAGFIAPIIGKQPPDSHIWISRGDSPTFVRSLSQVTTDGPLVWTELASPAWGR